MMKRIIICLLSRRPNSTDHRNRRKDNAILLEDNTIVSNFPFVPLELHLEDSNFVSLVLRHSLFVIPLATDTKITDQLFFFLNREGTPGYFTDLKPFEVCRCESHLDASLHLSISPQEILDSSFSP